MPFQLVALAKGAALIQSASVALAQWNALAPEHKALIREPGLDVVKGLNELRRALGYRMFGDDSVSFDEARDAALDPSVAFVLATRVVDVVRRDGRVGHETLARAVGAVTPEDGVLLEAIEIAKSDGYISAHDDGWAVTDFGDGRVTEAEHVVALERLIVDHIDEYGIAGTDALAEVAGLESSGSPVFRAALERALDSGRVQWLGSGLYGLSPEQLKEFSPPVDADEEDVAVPREVKAVVADVARAVDRLRIALAAVRRGDVPAPAALTAGEVARPEITRAADPLERLEKLKQLLDAGALSADEYAEQKARLLTAL